MQHANGNELPREWPALGALAGAVALALTSSGAWAQDVAPGSDRLAHISWGAPIGRKHNPACFLRIPPSFKSLPFPKGGAPP